MIAARRPMSITMQKIVVAVAFAASLAGCAGAGKPAGTDWPGYFARSNSIREECRRTNTTAVGAETCTTEQLRALPTGASSRDVLETHTAKRLAAAARLDRGEIGREAFDRLVRDVLETHTAKRLAAAARLDRGEIGREAFDRLVAGADSEASVELSRRDRLASAERTQSTFETTATENESTRQIKMLPRLPGR
jgi:hypothetical protein